jgi:hypothetical protein
VVRCILTAYLVPNSLYLFLPYTYFALPFSLPGCLFRLFCPFFSSGGFFEHAAAQASAGIQGRKRMAFYRFEAKFYALFGFSPVFFFRIRKSPVK